MEQEIDPGIVAIFGPPPPGLDVFETSITEHLNVLWFCVAVAILFVVLRFASRWVSGAALKADDYSIGGALVRSSSMFVVKGSAY